MEVMKKDMISRFQGKFKSIFACVIEDSTNEATQNSFEVMSPRFLMHCKGDEDKARKMWKDMLSWRQHNEIDTLLERSVPHFAAMKRHCPSAFHGRTREGKLVFYERVGAYQIGSMKKDKLGPKHVTSFTAFIQEYIFTHLITNDEERYMSGESFSVGSSFFTCRRECPSVQLKLVLPQKSLFNSVIQH